MPLRIRRSIRILPGVKLNVGKTRGSVSIGRRGASVNISGKGVHGTAGLPGTGISYRARLDKPSSERHRAAGTTPAKNSAPPTGCSTLPLASYPPPDLARTPETPWGYDPISGKPFSDKQKVVAGVLQILLGSFGAGRFYTGHNGLAVAQIAVTWLTCGLGAIWPFVDGILILASKDITDAAGRPLRTTARSRG